jgi:hypothetical protein
VALLASFYCYSSDFAFFATEFELLNFLIYLIEFKYILLSFKGSHGHPDQIVKMIDPVETTTCSSVMASSKMGGALG